LSEFRARLLDGEAERLLLDRLLDWCLGGQLLKVRGRQRTDSTHVLAKGRALNRLEAGGETMRHARDTLATAPPDWLPPRTRPDWADRYGRRLEDERLPTSKEAREAQAVAIGTDGFALLGAIYGSDAPAWLRALPAVETLRRVWVQNYLYMADGDGGRAAWRADDAIPPASPLIRSPHARD